MCSEHVKITSITICPAEIGEYTLSFAVSDLSDDSGEYDKYRFDEDPADRIKDIGH